jgi:hypothetical protein
MEREAQKNGGDVQMQPRRYEQNEAEPESELMETEPGYPQEPQEYVPADTWDGLEHLGHKTVITKKNKDKEEKFGGHWADLRPEPEDSYEP